MDKILSKYEADTETGLHYAGARYYDSRLSIFNSTDPMWYKYPSISPYAYCSDNPVMRIDPDGRADDEWDINRRGEIVNHIKTDKHDAFYMVDDNGKRIEGKELKFSYGTVQSQVTEFTPYYNKSRNELIIHTDTYNFKDNNSGYQAYLFLFQNTDVEWSHTQWKTSEFMPEEFGSTLITSHNKYAVLSPINPITNKKFLLSQSIPIKNYHSHPYGEYGYKAAIPSKADLKVRDRLDKRAGKNIEHFINIKLSNGSIGIYDFSKK